jgi:L-lactate dehydrogenase
MPVSVYLDDFYGISDLCLSVPAVIGSEGVSRILKAKLSPSEIDALHNSARVVRDAIDKTKSVYSG